MKKYNYILVILTVLFISLIAILIVTSSKGVGETPDNNGNIEEPKEIIIEDSEAILAGKKLSNGKCNGEGPVRITKSPMNPKDFSILIPYGLVVGGHVTPIDHQYFSPKDYNSKRDAYNVYAIADGNIVDIGTRDRVNPNNPKDKFVEYRIVFSHTCTFLSYFDLVTSLEPKLMAEFKKKDKGPNVTANIDFPVKAGQLIGKIGGQTLDFAVWDTQKPLKGFISPSLYDAESWKLYTANPYDYMSPGLKALLLERNPRTVKPIEGKIDYDIAGKLVGNWFVENTNGYSGTTNGRGGEYWKTHLSIAPDHFDPTVYRFSFGNIGGQALQFVSSNLNLNPSKIGIKSGITKVNLALASYTDSKGNSWNGNTLIKGPKLVLSNSPIYGCAIFQVLKGEKLKMETFVGLNCSVIKGFTKNVKVYVR